MNSNYQFSFWEKDSFLQPYDLIVIGAGIVGLSSALFYKQKHPRAQVLVVDKGFIPEGASTRNAGFACIGSITEHLADFEKESEENIKNRMVRRYNGLHLLRKTLGDETIAYENCGGYELFTSKESFEKAASEIDRFNGWMKELLDEDSVYQPTEFEGCPMIFNRLEGTIHPGKMMQTLVNRVMELGIPIRWNTQVAALNNGNIKIHTNTELQASQIVVAANGFTKQLLPELQITPARGFVMVTDEWGEIPWRGTFHYDCGYIYFRNVGNRLLLGGARNLVIDEEETPHFGTNETIKNYLMKFASEVLKLPEEVKIEQEWSGIMGFTPSKTPVLKRVDNHTIVAAGLSGMGIAIGMEVGKKAVQLLNSK